MTNVYVAEKSQLNTQNALLSDYNDDLSAIENSLSDIATLAQSKQSKTATPSASRQIVEADQGYSSLASVIVEETPLESKTVTPTIEQQTIIPEAPAIGFSEVTVEPVTPSIDPDIQPENIKQGVDILGVQGALKLPILITKQITENGVYKAEDDNADGYSDVEVSVYNPQFAALAQRTITTASDSNVTSIGDYAFYGCTGLTSINFPNVTSMGGNAFRWCPALTIVNFPNVTSIGASAFYDCTSLTSVDFPNATNIGGNAFRTCQALTSVNFPNATSIGASAFYDCTKLSTIILHKRATLANEIAIPSQTIVYVENDDLDWYSTATNWSAIYADGRIKSIDELPSEGGTT